MGKLVLSSFICTILAIMAGAAVAESGQPEQWSRYYSVSGTFSIEFPDKPMRDWRSLLNEKEQEFFVHGYKVRKPDREWVVLIHKGAPTGFLANDTKIGGYTARFNRALLSEWPHGAARTEKRQRAPFYGTPMHMTNLATLDRAAIERIVRQIVVGILALGSRQHLSLELPGLLRAVVVGDEQHARPATPRPRRNRRPGPGPVHGCARRCTGAVDPPPALAGGLPFP